MQRSTPNPGVPIGPTPQQQMRFPPQQSNSQRRPFAQPQAGLQQQQNAAQFGRPVSSTLSRQKKPRRMADRILTPEVEIFLFNFDYN